MILYCNSLSFCFLLLPTLLWGQKPIWLHNPSIVEASHVIKQDSSVIVGGIFQEKLHRTTAQGDKDIFFYQYSQTEKLIGKYYIGGKKKEYLTAVAAVPHGGWYGIGNFSDSLFFGKGDTALYYNKNRVFVAKWKNCQQLDWARQLNCTGWINVKNAVCDTVGALYLTGSFQDTLSLDTFPPLVAACTEAPFVIKINRQGNICWGYTSPVCQEAVGKALALDELGRLYWVGEFRGHFHLKKAFNRAHVVYRDLFLATLNSHTGAILRQKQFSGVYDNQCTALKYNRNQLYLAGRFSGYLQLDSFLLKTGFKTFGNAYVARLDTMGNTLWVSQSSAFADAYCTDLAIGQNKIMLAGYYLDSLQWEDKTASSLHKSEAFLLTFCNQVASELITGQGKGFDVVRGVVIDKQNNTWLVGGFQENIIWTGQTNQIAHGTSDGFIWRRISKAPSLPRKQSPHPNLIFPTVHLSPQPALRHCSITVINGGKLQQWKLYNTSGQLVKQGNTSIISTKGLREKVYSLHLHTSKGLAIEKFLIK